MPTYTIFFTRTAKEQYDHIDRTNPKKFKKVQKTLGLLETNTKHHGLQSHEYTSLKGPKNERMWEAYVENNTPSAYRVFYYYPDGEPGKIVVVAITPHP